MRGDREQTGKRPLLALRVNLYKFPAKKTGLLGAAARLTAAGVLPSRVLASLRDS